MMLVIGLMLALVYVTYLLHRIQLAIARACVCFSLLFLVALFLTITYFIFAYFGALH
jgi:hypothetical protein